ncbi:MAG TPA: transketolase [Chloroflexia bacterium]|nr:transketolase [Chloroflexia bacterium]
MIEQQTREALEELQQLAAQVRADAIRAVAIAKGGHLGGPLSAADLLVALYFRVLNVRPEEPRWPDRDRFILSKGHSCIALYATMAARGYFPRAELATFDAIDSRLQGHPDMKLLPGLDMSTGSLGQGISAGLGMALGARLLGKGWHTWVMLGDGECQEGQVWEAAHVAPRYALDNLTVIVDANGLQQYGWEGASPAGPRPPWASAASLAAIWQAFGWHTIQIDGHDMAAVLDACAQAKAHKGEPTVIIASTVKGKGVTFMAGLPIWHARVPTDDELQNALTELGTVGSGWEEVPS